MELETVLYRVEGNVGIVSLNRTKALNAMSKQIFVDLTTAFDAAEKDDTVRCVVVNAEGRAFCAGGDIPEMKGLDNPEAVFDFYNVAGIFMKKMINFVKPTITVAHGAIAGAGTSLLLAGDIALVSDDAMFMVAFGAVGLIPDCAGHWLLPRACGLNMAKELMMTQRAVKAPEMKELGLCNHVYPRGAADGRGHEAGQQDRQGPPELLQQLQAHPEQVLRDQPGGPAEGGDRGQAAARLHPNGDEGLAAFLEKRKANFQ
ncbi:MAG: enoyl-CoA hydratase/isomerase family protein [Evtepia gabavorous]